MKTVTINFLEGLEACSDSIKAFFKKEFKGKGVRIDRLVRFCIASNSDEYLRYGNWILTRCMTHEQRVRYAIFAARQVSHIYSDRYPNSETPCKAIEAARKWLRKPCDETRINAANVANIISFEYYSTLYVLTALSAFTDIWSANAAYDAARLSALDSATPKSTMSAILRYGIKLLKEDQA